MTTLKKGDKFWYWNGDITSEPIERTVLNVLEDGKIFATKINDYLHNTSIDPRYCYSKIADIRAEQLFHLKGVANRIGYFLVKKRKTPKIKEIIMT